MHVLRQLLARVRGADPDRFDAVLTAHESGLVAPGARPVG